ncbi:Oidioi.mRNA.OKI2018_I69.PAR.g8656.t1.cds [Oikopleura dioica]|uniref:Oidioi.mRNA.OKI2018_I69.PAR.g8656.t1.cds n=1 Tax=Oikopleura dioica TaxID=34765 RepID=A0ABN7RMD7_OIKDI|nr:Oidioi.mRNA.OKI2018_I69.PAR.g8656.t1.cds [Oikopleura dioica]
MMKLLGLTICSIFANEIFGGYSFNENCPDGDREVACVRQCSSDYDFCKRNCNENSFCEENCARDMFDCGNSCPCHTECFAGCIGCESNTCGACFIPEENEDFTSCYEDAERVYANCLLSCSGNNQCVSQCQEIFSSEIRNCPCGATCPNGCPCDNGYGGCPAETGLTVLGDSYFVLERVALFVENDNTVSKPNWAIPDRFVYDSGTALLKGQQFILGGLTNLTQIAILKDCSVEMQSQKLEIGFSQHYGDMTILNEKSYLCFSTSTTQWARCETFDGENVEVIEGRSNYGHYFGSLGHFENEFDNYMEKRSLTGSWEEFGTFPSEVFIERAATVQVPQGFMVVGGLTDAGTLSSIWLFDGNWTEKGALNKPVHSNTAILMKNNFIYSISGFSENREGDIEKFLWDGLFVRDVETVHRIEFEKNPTGDYFTTSVAFEAPLQCL